MSEQTNAPPADADPLRDRLTEEHKPQIDRGAELLASFERAPTEVNNEDTSGKVADFIKQLAAYVKATEGSRVAEKEPFLVASRAVDGFFKKLSEPVLEAKKEMERRLTVFQRAKEAEERKAREAAERLAREAAKKAREEAEAAAAALLEESDMESALAAEEAARVAAESAKEAAQRAEASAADLSRSRGDHGAVASLRTEWVGELVNRDSLDLESLRQHIPTDGLEKAVRSFVKAGGRELKGAHIHERHTTIVR